jgi:prolyl-tRNA synthetase
MQKDLLENARAFRKENSFKIDDYNELKKIIANDGGFVYSHWCGSVECEQQVKDETKATIRCIPFEREDEKGKCIVCGNNSDGRVIFAKAY